MTNAAHARAHDHDAVVPSPDALAWCLGRAGYRPPSAAVAVDLGWIDVELGAFDGGGSHQVRFRARGGAAWIEAVTYDADGDALPAMTRRNVRGLEYGFRSSIERLPPRPFAMRVESIVTHHRDCDHALIVSAPGGDLLTVLAAEQAGDGVRWRAWHGYPRTGDLVATVSDVRRR